MIRILPLVLLLATPAAAQTYRVEGVCDSVRCIPVDLFTPKRFPSASMRFNEARNSARAMAVKLHLLIRGEDYRKATPLAEVWRATLRQGQPDQYYDLKSDEYGRYSYVRFSTDD